MAFMGSGFKIYFHPQQIVSAADDEGENYPDLE